MIGQAYRGCVPPRSASSDWASGLAAVQRFVAQRGPRPVPTRAMAYGVAIGAWVAARRGDYWAGLLRPDEVAALEQVGGWTWVGPAQRVGAENPVTASDRRLHRWLTSPSGLAGRPA